MKCLICGKECEKIGTHVSMAHGLGRQEYCLQYIYEGKTSPTCPICGVNLIFRTYNGDHPVYCSRKCTHASPEWAKNVVESGKEARNRPEHKKKLAAILARRWASKEAHEHATKVMYARWADKEQRDALVKGLKEGHGTDSARANHRKAMQKRIKEGFNNDGAIFQLEGEHESSFFDSLDEAIEEMIIRQYVTPNSCYLDGYIKQLGIAIEFDEPYHESPSVQEADRLREKGILDCMPDIKFIRVKQREWENAPELVIKECTNTIKNA